jgi:DHA3 family macrolide efflux protein-like MFS transporter
MTTAAAQGMPLSFRDVLRITVMRRVWYAQVISLFGDFLALFAVIAVVSFTMHGTPAQLTGLQIAYMLPIVFVGPVAGVFVDRWPLKPTLVSSDLIRACLAMLLIPATTLWQVSSCSRRSVACRRFLVRPRPSRSGRMFRPQA